MTPSPVGYAFEILAHSRWEAAVAVFEFIGFSFRVSRPDPSHAEQVG